MNPLNDPLIELRADGAVAVLLFETSATSKLTQLFIVELTKLMTSAKRRPLVYATDRSIMIVCRSVAAVVVLSTVHGSRFDCSGQRFSDGPLGFSGSINLTSTTDAVELQQGGAWADDRDPTNVYRHELPIFNVEATEQALAALVERWITAGHIVAARPARVSPTVSPFVEIDFWTHPSSWDAADPRRFGSESRDNVLRLRREAGIPDSETRDYDSLQELRAHSRALAAAAPRERAPTRAG